MTIKGLRPFSPFTSLTAIEGESNRETEKAG